MKLHRLLDPQVAGLVFDALFDPPRWDWAGAEIDARSIKTVAVFPDQPSYSSDGPDLVIETFRARALTRAKRPDVVFGDLPEPVPVRIFEADAVNHATWRHVLEKAFSFQSTPICPVRVSADLLSLFAHYRVPVLGWDKTRPVKQT